MAEHDYNSFSREELIRVLLDRDANEAGGIRLTYQGQTPPWRIVRRVQPRRQKIEAKLSFGSEQDQACNAIVEGENLQAMASLYKYRGQVDLVLTDPPYNTGEDFRYNDRWDEDPNDPDLGAIVPAEDGSRHSKWMRFMAPRLWMMREMLRPGGVLAICIDHRELFRLGMMLDEIFGEINRIGIINWQKAYAPKSDTGGLLGGVSSATEYVLVYAKNSDRAQTHLLNRTEAMNARYTNPDSDPEGDWASDNPSGPSASTHRKMVYAIQSPFTGVLYYPPQGRCWGNEKKKMKEWLEGWGSRYEEKWIDDDNEFFDEDSQKSIRVKALVLEHTKFANGKPNGPAKTIAEARRQAEEKLKSGDPWPRLFFTSEGEGGPRLKRYLKDSRKGKVAMTYWADEDYEEPFELGTQSWDHEESGHSQTGVKELDALVGSGHNFKTVKPLKLFRKIIQLWCPPNGIVLDCFAGSGTTGHAVLELNQEIGTSRRFVLIEQGRPDKGDPYARGLTVERIRHAITGDRFDKKGGLSRSATPLGGGFRFSKLMLKVDAAAVLALEREEMIDLLLTSHWDQVERAAAHLHRLPAGNHSYLFAISARNEGFFLVWSGPGNPAVLDRNTYRSIAEEAKSHGVSAPLHVYARTMTYSGPGIEFYQIPDRILEKLGFNTTIHAYTVPMEHEEVPA